MSEEVEVESTALVDRLAALARNPAVYAAAEDAPQALRHAIAALSEARAVLAGLDKKALFERSPYEHAVVMHCLDTLAFDPETDAAMAR